VFGVFLGDGRKALHQKHPSGKKELPSRFRIIGFQKKETRFRRVAPQRYAFPSGKDANSRPHQNRNGGADYVVPRSPRPGVAGGFAGAQDTALVQNRLDFYHLKQSAGLRGDFPDLD